MSSNSKVFGAKDESKQKKEDEKRFNEGVSMESESADDLLEKLKADSKKKATSRKKKKIEEYKAIRATKEALFSRMGEVIDVPIIMSDDEVMVFKVKRLSESENSEILDRSLAIKDMTEMTPEELEESNNYNYRLLEKVVVEPKLSQDDWKINVDTALVQTIVQQVMKVLTNVDDSRIFDDFQR